MQKHTAVMGSRPRPEDPPLPQGGPAPRPGGSCRSTPGQSGPLGRVSCPPRRVSGQRRARGAPHPASPHPARAPQSAPGAARAILAAPAATSARAESRRRGRGPDPLAPRLPCPPPAGRSRPHPPCPSGASRRRRLSPAPPPIPARREGKGGGRGRLPPPHSHPPGLSRPPPPARGMLGLGVQPALGSRGTPQPGLPLPETARAPRDCGLRSSRGFGRREGGLYRAEEDRGRWEISNPRRPGYRRMKQSMWGVRCPGPGLTTWIPREMQACPGCPSVAAVASCGRTQAEEEPPAREPHPGYRSHSRSQRAVT